MDSPTTTTEDAALSTRTEQSSELAPIAAGVGIEAEIKASITVALRFPRNEDRAFEKLMHACRRPSFAENASYSFPRAGSDVSGPSIYLAREAARVWGNIRHGANIVADSEASRTIEAWAWDLETNTKVAVQDTFQKLIYRKKGGWLKPDERDLRELTNRRAAIAKRNCILEILPKDLIDDAQALADEILSDKAAKDPDGERKRIVLAFSQIGVGADMLQEYLGHPIGQSSPTEIATLRRIYKSIVDGNSTWSEYGSGGNRSEATGGVLASLPEALRYTVEKALASLGLTPAQRLVKINEFLGNEKGDLEEATQRLLAWCQTEQVGRQASQAVTSPAPAKRGRPKKAESPATASTPTPPPTSGTAFDF